VVTDLNYIGIFEHDTVCLSVCLSFWLTGK